MKKLFYLYALLLMSNLSNAQWTYRYLTDKQYETSTSFMFNKDTGITMTRLASNPDKFSTVITYNGFQSYSYLTALDTSLTFNRNIVKTGEGGFMLITDDSFYLTHNWGQSFVTKPMTYPTYVHQWYNNKLFAEDYDTVNEKWRLVSSLDTGQTWTLVSDTFDKYYILNDQVIWVMRESRHGDLEHKTELWRTTNGGSSWQYMHTAYTGGNDIFQTYQNCFFLDENTGFWTKESIDSLFKTTDGGATWNYQGAQPRTFFYLYFINEQVGFAGRISIHKTVDGGKTWTMQMGASIRGFHCIDSMQCFAYREEPGAVFYTDNQGGGPFTALPEQVATGSTLNLFPNPAHSNLTVQLKQMAIQQPISIQMFDVVGRQVLQKSTSTQTTELDISKLAPGMYMMEIRGEGIKESAKVLVE